MHHFAVILIQLGPYSTRNCICVGYPTQGIMGQKTRNQHVQHVLCQCKDAQLYSNCLPSGVYWVCYDLCVVGHDPLWLVVGHQDFLDTIMLVLAMRNGCVGGHAKHEAQCKWVRILVENGIYSSKVRIYLIKDAFLGQDKVNDVLINNLCITELSNKEQKENRGNNYSPRGKLPPPPLLQGDE